MSTYDKHFHSSLNLDEQRPEGQTSLRKYLRTIKAAQYLNISKSTLDKLAAANKIAFSKPNGKIRLFLVEDLDKYAMRNRIPTNDELLE
jgi:excisionase family DNA binding protein